MADYDGKLHTLGGKAKEVWLGHLNTCTGKTEPDVERRIQLSNQGFWRTYHVWKNTDIDPELKTEMFRRFVAKLVYAGAATWILSDEVCQLPPRTAELRRRGGLVWQRCRLAKAIEKRSICTDGARRQLFAACKWWR